MAIIGTSLGGLLAMMLAYDAPEMVAGVVLNDVGPEINPAGAERIRRYAGRLPPVSNWAEAIAQLREVYGPSWPGLSDSVWTELVRRSYREGADSTPVLDVDPMVGEAMRSSASPAPNLWPIFATLGTIPILAIRGSQSDILSEALFARMQREKPDLEGLTVANRGHVPLLDEPECLVAIDAFLARLGK